MKYVDGFVFVVKNKNIRAYNKMASAAAKIWKKHGALQYFECKGDDLNPNTGGGMKTSSFPKMVKLRKGESVWFSFITYKSKSHRDAVNKKVMKDPMMDNPEWKDKPMPFEMSRMAYGGFKAIVQK